MRLHVCDGSAPRATLNRQSPHSFLLIDFQLTIIFQGGQAGLEADAPDAPGRWALVPGDATIVLCGWCALILSGGRIRAARHRVRRVPGIRRLSAVLFVAPDLDVLLKPLKGDMVGRPFPEKVSN